MGGREEGREEKRKVNGGEFKLSGEKRGDV